MTINPKTIKYLNRIFLPAFLFIFSNAFSQTINWNNTEHRNILNVNVAAENSNYIGLGYAYKINNGKKPIFITAETSFSVENDKFDDYNSRIGIQMKIFQWQNYVFSSKTHFVYSFYNADIMKLYNFGTNLSWDFGYYLPKWFISAEGGYDRILTSYIKYSNVYKSQFPNVKDGCDKAYTDGNFYYRINGGYTFGNKDITLSVGNVINQDFRNSSSSSFYSQIGFNYKF